MFYEVLVSKIFRKSPNLQDGILTYAYDKPLTTGTIVTIPLGRSNVTGIIYKKVPDPKASYKIKSISSVVYSTPLPKHILRSILWLSKYYLTPLPQVVSLVLPTGITKKRRSSKTTSSIPKQINTNTQFTLSTKNSIQTNINLNCSYLKSSALAQPAANIPLNSAQKTALKELNNISSTTKLLHGITGSGKTNIYLSLAADTLAKEQSVILLVPEIALTSQLVEAFESTFKNSVTLIHSKQTESTRHKIWEKILISSNSTPHIIIGPRSALLAPVANLGLIIIDEAHEGTYFQEQPPKYNALRLASFIAKENQISCVLGTATPLVSDLYLAQKNNAYVTLTEKAKTSAITPDIKIVDFKDRENFIKSRYFSTPLLNAISDNLKNHHQTLIFHNRRGSAPLTICESCGWQALCPNCYLPLTLHTDSYNLVCHACGLTEKIPTCCPNCQHPNIIHKGFGTKLLESELKKLFKTARIARFDTDNTKDSTLVELYDDVKSGQIDIIIGTQTVARGFDFPSLATVGIVQADAGLNLPDYSAEERTFHLLSQVLGRIGRGHINVANAIIQTYQPTHPAITNAITNNYTNFTDYLLKKRRKSCFPPFYYIARLSVVFKTESIAVRKITAIYYELKSLDPSLIISQPTPSFHEHTPSGFSWQIIAKSPSRTKLITAIYKLSSFPTIHLTLDPPSLL